MSALVVAHPGRAAMYGAEELKRAAHRYGFIALSISVLIHFSVVGLYYLNAMFESAELKPKGPYGPGPLVILDPSPPIPGVYQLPPPAGPTTQKMREVGTPVPVVDDPATMENTIATQGDLADLVDPHGVDFPSGSIVQEPDVVVDDGPPPIFVPFEKGPVVVKSVAPVYPPLALKAGLEGRVFVKIWVDKQGKPRQVEILKSDYEILNDAAVEAAKHFVFTPAYMNNGPVSVWVSLPFIFKLSKETK